jgi:hypothetical protein
MVAQTVMYADILEQTLELWALLDLNLINQCAAVMVQLALPDLHQ